MNATGRRLSNVTEFALYRQFVHSDLTWYEDKFGVVAVYTCHTGYQFALGGTSRTALCLNGVCNTFIVDCVGEYGGLLSPAALTGMLTVTSDWITVPTSNRS
jgi:hypothetical protein